MLYPFLRLRQPRPYYFYIFAFFQIHYPPPPPPHPPLYPLPPEKITFRVYSVRRPRIIIVRLQRLYIRSCCIMYGRVLILVFLQSLNHGSANLLRRSKFGKGEKSPSPPPPKKKQLNTAKFVRFNCELTYRSFPSTRYQYWKFRRYVCSSLFHAKTN